MGMSVELLSLSLSSIEYSNIRMSRKLIPVILRFLAWLLPKARGSQVMGLVHSHSPISLKNITIISQIALEISMEAGLARDLKLWGYNLRAAFSDDSYLFIKYHYHLYLLNIHKRNIHWKILSSSLPFTILFIHNRYIFISIFNIFAKKNIHDGNRTHNLLLRRQTLYHWAT